MDFQSFDLENLTTGNLSVEMGYDKRKKIKNMLIGLINEGQKLIKETEKKRPAFKPTVVVRNVRFVPKGLTISQKKSPKHEEIKPEINFLCGICKLNFKAINLLSEHSKVCKSINLKTDLQSTIDNGQNIDLSVKAFNFNCGICKNDFETFVQLSKHSEECKPINLEVENFFEDDFNDIDDQMASPDPPIEINLKCEICENNFETLDLLSEHSKKCKSICLDDNAGQTQKSVEPQKTLKLFKMKNGKYRCSVCNKCFDNLKPGMLHVAKHYPNFTFVKKGEKLKKNRKVIKITHQIKSVVFKCSTCLKSFSNYSNLIEHELTHKQQKSTAKKKDEATFNDEIPQQQISEEFTHKQQKSTAKKKDEATFNDEIPQQISEEFKKKIIKEFKAAKDLKITRQCKICDKKFYRNIKEFNNHIHTEHKSVETFQCSVCEKITFTKIALDSHMLLGHTDLMANKYQCEKCDHVPFKTKLMLFNHLARKHSDFTKIKKTNICEICGKVLCDISSKERHVASVHENKIEFICEYCGKGFKTSDRETHYRTHTGERPFNCDQCDSKFRHRHDLTIHKRLHTGERPFECTICHQRFIASTNLNKHLKSRHVVNTEISI